MKQILKLNETISKVQKELEKKIKTCNKLKRDRSYQSDKNKKSARTSKKKKKRKRLSELKPKVSSAKSKFENSSISKKFKKASAELLSIPGPKETEFLKLEIKFQK